MQEDIKKLQVIDLSRKDLNPEDAVQLAGVLSASQVSSVVRELYLR